jgi:hypothetical protein
MLPYWCWIGRRVNFTIDLGDCTIGLAYLGGLRIHLPFMNIEFKGWRWRKWNTA